MIDENIMYIKLTAWQEATPPNFGASGPRKCFNKNIVNIHEVPSFYYIRTKERTNTVPTLCCTKMHRNSMLRRSYRTSMNPMRLNKAWSRVVANGMKYFIYLTEEFYNCFNLALISNYFFCPLKETCVATIHYLNQSGFDCKALSHIRTNSLCSVLVHVYVQLPTTYEPEIFEQTCTTEHRISLQELASVDWGKETISGIRWIWWRGD